MIINNQNKKLSRNRKRRIERNIEMDDEMKSLLKNIETKNEKKNKNVNKIKELEIKLVKIKYANNPDRLINALKELTKLHVVYKNLHEIKQKLLVDYTGEFEMVGNLKVGNQIRQTHIRFRKMAYFESYINAIDEGYDAEDAISNGYFYKLNTQQFNKVIRSQYGNGCDFKHKIIEYHGNNCYIPTKSFCFVKCVKLLTGEDYKQKYLDFIRNERRRSNIMTKARIQPFCRANNVNLRYYSEDRDFP